MLQNRTILFVDNTANQTELVRQLDHVTLPKKGKLSRERKVVEQSEEFIKTRCVHSAVESAINALEIHGLNKCPDHNIEGFERYVSVAAVARNIHRIGDILCQQDVARARRANARKKVPANSLKHSNEEIAGQR